MSTPTLYSDILKNCPQASVLTDSMLFMSPQGEFCKLPPLTPMCYLGTIADIDNPPKVTAIYAINASSKGTFPTAVNASSGGGAMVLNWAFLGTNRVQLIFLGFANGSFYRHYDSGSPTKWSTWMQFSMTAVSEHTM